MLRSAPGVVAAAKNIAAGRAELATRPKASPRARAPGEESAAGPPTRLEEQVIEVDDEDDRQPKAKRKTTSAPAGLPVAEPRVAEAPPNASQSERWSDISEEDEVL